MPPKVIRSSPPRVLCAVALSVLFATACGTNGIRQSESQGTVPPDPHYSTSRPSYSSSLSE